MKPPLILSLVVAGIISLAPAADAAGVNLAWDACTPEGGVQNKSFACNSNSGGRTLYGSFVLANDQPHFVGAEMTIDIVAEHDSLPPWWQFYNPNTCRRFALTVSFSFAIEPNEFCADPWSGQATGGIGAYSTPAQPGGDPNSARLTFVAAVPSTMPMQLSAGTEYYCFKILISSAKTAGTSACGGCDVPVCILLSRISAVQNNGTQEDLVTPVVSSVATWQSAESCPAGSTPENITWGQIRSVLR